MERQAAARPKSTTRPIPPDAARFINENIRIDEPHGDALSIIPFRLWPAQTDALARLLAERLIVFLKARQVGITWLTLAYALWLCLARPGRVVLLFSKTENDAWELARRVRMMYLRLPEGMRESVGLARDNLSSLEWSNGSRVHSLAATKGAGRSFTASLVILDEFAFMQYAQDVYTALKPTVDGGGQMIVISSANGEAGLFHDLWDKAQAGRNNFFPIFLSWRARPDRDDEWRRRVAREALSEVAVLQEYPNSPEDAFRLTVGQVYDTWLNLSAPEGNISEAAEYEAGAGEVLWGVDDGYAGELDAVSQTFKANSHPRVFLLFQRRGNGQLYLFREHYAVRQLSDRHLMQVCCLPYSLDDVPDGATFATPLALRQHMERERDKFPLLYPMPEYAAVDKSAAELRGRLHELGVYTRGCSATVEESVKVTRRFVAPDENGVRRLLVHPRCVHFRREMNSYRRDDTTGLIVKASDHGPDAARYLTWNNRSE